MKPVLVKLYLFTDKHGRSRMTKDPWIAGVALSVGRKVTVRWSLRFWSDNQVKRSFEKMEAGTGI